MLEKGTKVFGEWLIDERIGSGAYGTVYKIKREEFGEIYYAALKVINIPQDPQDQMRLRSEGMDDESITTYYGQLAQNFVQEIKLLSSLDGVTNIVDYKDHSIVPNDSLGYTIYIKMQLLTPLSKLLVDADNKALFLSKDETLRVGIDICSALELCEKQKIIHRDIKVDNIFVSSNGDYKLGDFGIAKQLESTHGEMSKKGTMMYMAPEVFRGENYNNTADIYSLGIVLYRLLNKNRAPFFPEYPTPIKFSDKETANMKRLGGDVALPAIPGVSDELMAVLRKACAHNPAYRFKSATELKQALTEVKNVGTFNYKSTVNNQQPVRSEKAAMSNSMPKANPAASNSFGRPAVPNTNPQTQPVRQNREPNIGAIPQMPSPKTPQQRNPQQKPAQPKVIHPKSLQQSAVNEVISQSQENIYRRKNDEIKQPAGTFSRKPVSATEQQKFAKQTPQYQSNAVQRPKPKIDDDSTELEQTMGIFSDTPVPAPNKQKNTKPTIQQKSNPIQYTTPQFDDESDELEQTMGIFSELPSVQNNTTDIVPQKKKHSKGKIIALVISILTFLGISATVLLAIVAILLSSSGY